MINHFCSDIGLHANKDINVELLASFCIQEIALEGEISNTADGNQSADHAIDGLKTYSCRPNSQIYSICGLMVEKLLRFFVRTMVGNICFLLFLLPLAWHLSSNYMS